MLACQTIALAESHCVVLQYHHVSAHTPPITSVTPTLFEQHLEHLEQNQFQVLALSQVVKDLRNAAELPDKCVAITFDDAYDSIYTEALPRLRKRGWPFTLFINTQGVDQGISSYLDWDQLREMGEAGVEFGNHSHTHTHLIRPMEGEDPQQWRTRIRQDLELSSQRIREETGQNPTLHAYPYGEYNPQVQALVRELGLSAFGQQSGPIWPGADFTALPRFPMAAGFAAMPSFKTKVLTLPLPLRQTPKLDPVLPLDQVRPLLSLQLDLEHLRPGQLNCYVSGQDKAQIDASDEYPGSVTVRAKQDLSVGRSRYNCTTPSRQTGRFHWFSQTWIRRKPDGSWYAEY